MTHDPKEAFSPVSGVCVSSVDVQERQLHVQYDQGKIPKPICQSRALRLTVDSRYQRFGLLFN